MRLGELAERLGCKLEGDAGIEIRGVRGLEDAGPEDLTFVTEERYLTRLRDTPAAAAIVAEGLPAPGRPTLRTSNPYLALARALAVFHPSAAAPSGIHPTAAVAAEYGLNEMEAAAVETLKDESIDALRSGKPHPLVLAGAHPLGTLMSLVVVQAEQRKLRQGVAGA